MLINFQYKSISELLGDNFYRQKQFTLEELAQYDGKNGRPTYVAVDGVVYDLSKVGGWDGGTHFNVSAGKDATEEFNFCHGIYKLSNIPKVGILIKNKDTKTLNAERTEIQDTYDFSPDEWVQYITPLVDDALEEVNTGLSLEYVFEKYILIGILVGQGRTFEEAINVVEDWETSGMAKLLDESKGESD